MGKLVTTTHGIFENQCLWETLYQCEGLGVLNIIKVSVERSRSSKITTCMIEHTLTLNSLLSYLTFGVQRKSLCSKIQQSNTMQSMCIYLQLHCLKHIGLLRSKPPLTKTVLLFTPPSVSEDKGTRI